MRKYQEYRGSLALCDMIIEFEDQYSNIIKRAQEIAQHEVLYDIANIINDNDVSPDYALGEIIGYLEGKGFKV